MMSLMMTPEAPRLGVVGLGVGWFGGSVLCGGVLSWVAGRGWVVSAVVFKNMKKSTHGSVSA